MKTVITSNFEAEWMGRTMNKTITLKEKPSNESGKKFIAYNELNERIGEYDNLKQFAMVLTSEERRLKASNLSIQNEVGLWMNKISKELKEIDV